MDVDALADAMYLAREECVDDVAFLCGVMVDSCECLTKLYESNDVDEACYAALTTVNEIIDEKTERHGPDLENRVAGIIEGQCTDDPKGYLKGRESGSTCVDVVAAYGCEYDLHDRGGGTRAPPGFQVYMLCPLSCDACEDDTDYASPLYDFEAVVQDGTFKVDLIEPEEDFSCSSCRDRGFAEDQCLCGVCGSFGFCTFSCHAEVDERYESKIAEHVESHDIELAPCIPSRYAAPGCWFGKAHSTSVLKDWLRGCKKNCKGGCSNSSGGRKDGGGEEEQHGFRDWNHASGFRDGSKGKMEKVAEKEGPPVEFLIVASSVGVVGMGLGYLVAARRRKNKLPKGKVLDTTSFQVPSKTVEAAKCEKQQPLDDDLGC
jgi:hypothetical protein